MPMTTYLGNKVLDHVIGKTSYTMPGDVWLGLIRIRAQSQNLRSTEVSVGDLVMPATPNGRLYRCTTAGTTGSSEPDDPNGWPVTEGGTVTDGTAVWTEHTPSFRANSNCPELEYTGYARVQVDAAFGAASGGSSANASDITFGTKTGGADELIGAWMTFDDDTGGNPLEYGVMTAPKLIEDADFPFFPAGSFVRSNF